MEQMTAMMEVYRNTRNKVDYVRNLLYPEQDDATDFSAVVPVLMSYYPLPSERWLFFPKQRQNGAYIYWFQYKFTQLFC